MMAFCLRWLAIFFVASLLVFGVVRLLPTGPAVHYLTGMNLPLTQENIESITKSMGLDKPLHQQYLTWVAKFLQGDWGTSLTSNLDIRTEFMAKMPYSLAISLGGISFGAVFAYGIGYCAAVHRGGFWDRGSRVLAVLTQAIPVFLIAIVVIHFFGVKLRIAKFFTGDSHLAIVASILIMACYKAAAWARVVRKAFREEMSKSYVRFSIARGFDKKKVLLFHSYRPVLCSLIAVMIADFASVFGGSTVLEFAFAIPGISYFLVSCMKHSDYTVLQSYILVVICWMFLVHLLFGLLLEVLDVRRRKGGLE